MHIVEMLRWGDDESHHYIIGAYRNLSDATYAGEVEKAWRGGKYEYRIISTVIDSPLDKEKVKQHEDCF